MKRFLQPLSFIAIIAGMMIAASCTKENNLEKAYKLTTEQGDKIEVAEALVSDTIIMDSLNNEQIIQLEECLEYLKGSHEMMPQDVQQKLDVILTDKITRNINRESSVIGGEVIDEHANDTEGSADE